MPAESAGASDRHRSTEIHKLNAMLHEQHRLLTDLSGELQRKEVTPERVTRLMKIVIVNVEILQRMADMIQDLYAKIGHDLIDRPTQP